MWKKCFMFTEIILNYKNFFEKILGFEQNDTFSETFPSQN